MPATTESKPDRPWPIQLFRFALVGVAGFLVDAGSLQAYLVVAPGHFYSGRALSYVIAATTTWALNAWFTFGRSGGGIRQWGRFLLFNLSGGAVNYTIYAALVATVPATAQMPVLAVAAGSLGGLGVNFLVSRYFVFAKA